MKLLLAGMLWIAAVLLAGCAATDGGIVGTGNRVDCETAAKKGADRESLPPECREQRRP
jgi:hypothetical protein